MRAVAVAVHQQPGQLKMEVLVYQAIFLGRQPFMRAAVEVEPLALGRRLPGRAALAALAVALAELHLGPGNLEQLTPVAVVEA